MSAWTNSSLRWVKWDEERLVDRLTPRVIAPLGLANGAKIITGSPPNHTLNYTWDSSGA